MQISNIALYEIHTFSQYDFLQFMWFIHITFYKCTLNIANKTANASEICWLCV